MVGTHSSCKAVFSGRTYYVLFCINGALANNPKFDSEFRISTLIGGEYLYSCFMQYASHPYDSKAWTLLCKSHPDCQESRVHNFARDPSSALQEEYVYGAIPSASASGSTSPHRYGAIVPRLARTLYRGAQGKCFPTR